MMNIKSLLAGAAMSVMTVLPVAAQQLPSGFLATGLYAVFPKGQQFQVGVYASPGLCEHYKGVADAHMMTPMVRENHGRYVCVPVRYVPPVPASGCVMGCGDE